MVEDMNTTARRGDDPIQGCETAARVRQNELITHEAENELVTVVIVNANTRDLLLRCIESIKRNTRYPSYRIVVVDDASTDGSAEAVECNHPDVEVMRNPRNLGFGASNNRALSSPTGYFFLLNPDTLLKNDAVTIFHDFYVGHRHERIGVLGSYLLSAGGADAYSFGPRLTIRRILKELAFKVGGLVVNAYRSRTVRPAERTIRKVATVVGAAMFFSSGLIRQVGRFDRRFFMYHEEADHQERVRRAGYSNFVIPGPEIVHFEGQSFAKASNRRRIMVQTSHIAFVRKWYGPLAEPFKLCLMVLLLLNLVVDFIKREYSPKENWRYFSMVARERYL